ncbi:MAG: YbfB/YjiJ family MFS transporter [Acidimicrobiales bacterium]
MLDAGTGRHARGRGGHPLSTAAVRHPYRLAASLAMGPAVGIALARFAYALLLPAMRSQLHWSYGLSGVVGGANALGYLAGACIANPLHRRLGTRTVFGWSIGLTVAVLAATALTGQIAVLLTLRTLAGVLAALIFTGGLSLVAAIGENGSHRKAVQLLATYTTGVGAGLVVSGIGIPWLLSSVSRSDGWRWCWLLLASLAALAFLASLPALRCSPEPVLPRTNDDRALVGGRLSVLLVSCCLYGAGYVAYLTFVVAYLEDHGASGRLVTVFWVVLGTVAIVSAALWPRVTARMRADRAPGTMIGAVSVGAVLPLVDHAAVVSLISGSLFGASFLAVVAAYMAVIRQALPARQWGPAFAVFTMALGVGQCLGPLLTGFLSDARSGLAVGLSLSVALLAASGALALVHRQSAVPSAEGLAGSEPEPMSR